MLSEVEDLIPRGAREIVGRAGLFLLTPFELLLLVETPSEFGAKTGAFLFFVNDGSGCFGLKGMIVVAGLEMILCEGVGLLGSAL